jgi:hypothetical protein
MLELKRILPICVYYHFTTSWEPIGQRSKSGISEMQGIPFKTAIHRCLLDLDNVNNRQSLGGEMEEYNAFVSVGATANEKQEAFVRAVEERLRSEGVIPHTVGRNTFSADSPLKTVMELMEKCHGTVIVALERTYFPSGEEKRGGPNQINLTERSYATPWNQIEAAKAYAKGHPLMIIMEKGLHEEGLLGRGYEW